ncbi:MAG: response regulator transcription factor [Ktedonobacteraceae bacterium]|nr:response regulator transcription factor [Ktedonobacteraceae bacterium]
MFLVSKRVSGRSEHFWPNLARPGVGIIIVFSLLLDPLTIQTRQGTIVISGLFLAWGLLAAFADTFHHCSAQIAGIIAFVDLFFSGAIVVFCHGFSLVWLPVLFLLPTLELSSLYGTRGIAFVIIAFIWTFILSALTNLTLFQQPLWWLVALLWGTFILFTATLQTTRMGEYVRPSTLQVPQQTDALAQRDELHTPAQEELVQARFATLMPQIVMAFERPFRHMGVHTDDHRQEIEAALHTLYNVDMDMDQEALSLCLDRLLQAAKQNWVGLAAFSPREQEILELLLQNCTYKEMSSRLHVSPSTIKTHIYHIFQKLDVSNRDDAMRLIHKRGWFSSHLHEPMLLEASS